MDPLRHLNLAFPCHWNIGRDAAAMECVFERSQEFNYAAVRFCSVVRILRTIRLYFKGGQLNFGVGPRSI